MKPIRHVGKHQQECSNTACTAPCTRSNAKACSTVELPVCFGGGDPDGRTGIAASEVRLEGGGAPAEGVVRLQASGVDPDETLRVAAQAKVTQQKVTKRTHTSDSELE